MRPIFTLHPIWILIGLTFCFLAGASVASAQDADEIRVESDAGAVLVAASPLANKTSYNRNRESFQQQRAAVQTEVQRLDAKIQLREQALQTLADEKSKISAASLEQPSNEPGVLRSFTHTVESAVVSVINPLIHYLPGVFGLSAEAASSLDQPRSKVTGQSGYVNLVLPVMVLLTLLLIKNKRRDFYEEHRHYLKPLAAFLILIFPLSSFAQEQTAPSTPVQESPESLTTKLLEADGLLRLSRVQRYIKLLSADDTRGRRVRISDVDFGDVPIQYFESFVVGSGEYHTTLAALYIADGNPLAAVKQLRPLAFADTRYASKSRDQASYEALLSKSAAYLLSSNDPQLARDIVQLHMDELRSIESFNRLYPELLRSGYSATAAELASRVMAQSTNADELVGYASVLLQSESVFEATTSLNKALEIATSPDVLMAVIDIGLSLDAAEIIANASAKAQEAVTDPATIFLIAEKLRAGGWREESTALLQTAVNRASSQASSIVGGELLSSTEALKYISYQSFERGFLSIAEQAAIAAIKPLSSAERRALLMPVPVGDLDPIRVPEPDRLVAPLYLGLLYEKQGRNGAARQRFETESRRLIESVIDSSGLYVPEMINHLSLLGSVLDEKEDAAELTQLDNILVHLEQLALEGIRSRRAEEVSNREARLEQLDTEIQNSKAELATLKQGIETNSGNSLGEALSALLLLLRNLSLIAVLLFYLSSATAIALRFTLERSTQRTSACWWKFVECLGWVWVLSVFSAPLGLGAIVVAQYFLLNQARSDDWIRLTGNTQGAVAENTEQGAVMSSVSASMQNSDKGLETASRSTARKTTPLSAADKQWKNVVQMLRDTKDIEAS
ncbi:MAG: hypothetical protein AB8B57_08760 [Congregibacter sp.]